MVIFGLTGSIAMGKSTAAGMLRRLGIPVHHSDAAVHGLLATGGAAVSAVGAAFPNAVRDGAIDRKVLGAIVYADKIALGRLESLLHPLVSSLGLAFLKQAAGRGTRLAVLDIPLLFETGAECRCDAVIVVSAPALLQRQRALSRPAMNPAKLAAILARQMPDSEKRRRADFVVPSGLGRAVTLRALAGVVRQGMSMAGGHWPPCPRHWQRGGSGRHA